MTPLLQIDQLAVRFAANGTPENNVLAGVNLEIFSTETLALVGESGCGKSTVARAILRLIAPPGKITSGKIYYRGEDLLALSEKRMRQIRWKEIAMIFQETGSALNPLRRAGSQVVEVLRLHLGVNKKAAKIKTLELFESVALPEATRCFEAYPHELSSGMRQRVLIAMALACMPKLIIADEPTTALDARHQQEILVQLLALKDKVGLGLLFITHDFGLIAKWADRVAIMHEGRIIEAGASGEILARPQHAHTMKLLAAAKRFHQTDLTNYAGTA
ncbi:ABC transporter ATP-binding protein [candidate division KSB1 bacterium]|nr:ABC transporter ATP-binding protein [candidate division KSB1 bacterium]